LLPSSENLAKKQPKKKTTSSKKTKRETKQNADLQQLRMITIFTPQMSLFAQKHLSIFKELFNDKTEPGPLG
jgi:hypothetical protein